MEATTISTQEKVVLTRPKDKDDNKNTSIVVKGKRTKRQRPQSPLPLTIIPSRGHEGECGSNNIYQYGSNIIGLTNNHDNIPNNLSTTTSIEFQESTEEEEDMANCLILLAQGQFRPGISPKGLSPSREDHARINEYNSRKLLETLGTGGTGKAGNYVYECRTCNRTFPSFQALGGHRASHKKPKAMADEKRNNNNFIGFLSSYEDYDHDITLKSKKNSSAFSLQLSQRSLYESKNHNTIHNKPKVHECSICGAEFTSGQALGGHMRRHRAVPKGTNTTLSLTPIGIKTDKQQFEPPKNANNKNVLSLDLDLNLPAPEEFENRESKFSFVSSKQQQSSLVFSAPALVDCHF